MERLISTLRFSRPLARRLVPAIGMAVLFFTSALAAAPATVAGPKGSREKIHIIADELTADGKAKVAEFTGHVKATQGTTVIESDTLRIYYREAPPEDTAGTDAGESIERIEASGHVRIRFENRLAETEEAIYNMDTQVFVLTGAGTRVTSGNHYIAGEKITLQRADGKVFVESGDRQRVEAVFFPEDKEGAKGDSGN
jgi:lipopolysaccharide export system protein LptA